MKKKIEYKKSDLSMGLIRDSIKQLNDLPKRVHTFNEPLALTDCGLYRISDQCYGNKAAWDAFNKELIKRGEEIIGKYKH